MTFQDIIKKTVLESFQAGDLSTTTMVLTLFVALVMGAFIYFIYRTNTKSGFYNRGFNKTLALLPVITAAIMLAMGSSLTISLGMVGALSIVRFRNAVKDPVDLTYLFWSISVGIVTGAGLFELAIILSVIIAIAVNVFDLIPVFSAPSILVVSGEKEDIEVDMMVCLKEFSKSVKVRSRSINSKGVEWIFELKATDERALVSKIASMESIMSVHLMTHDGDVRF